MDLLINFSSSTFASFSTYPIELIKSQYQVTRLNNPNISTLNLIKNMYKHRGLIGFYRGISSHVATYPIFWTVFFYNKEHNKYQFTENIYVDNIIKTTIASTIGSALANPLFVLRTRMQTENLVSNNKISYHKLINKIVKQEGILGLMKGLNTTIMSNSKLCFQFPLYDYIKEKSNNVLFSAVLSRLITSVIFYPFDFIRTIQRNSEIKMSLQEIFKDVIKKYKLIGLYQGVMLYALTSSPNYIIMMLTKEKLTNIINT